MHHSTECFGIDEGEMKRKQRGAQLVEFALVGGVFLSVLFAVLVFGYWFHVYDTLTEAVRRGARVAAVCPKYSENIYLATVFATTTTSTDHNATQTWPSATSSPILPQLTSNMVTVTYTPDVGGESEAKNGFYDTVKYVTVAIEGYAFTNNMPVLGQLGTLPRVEATLSAESMGRTSLDPDNPARSCLMP